MRYEARENGREETNNGNEIVTKAPPDEQRHQSGHDSKGEVRILSHVAARLACRGCGAPGRADHDGMISEWQAGSTVS